MKKLITFVIILITVSTIMKNPESPWGDKTPEEIIDSVSLHLPSII